MSLPLSQSELTALTTLFVQLRRVIPSLTSPVFRAETIRSLQSAAETLRVTADHIDGAVPSTRSGSNGATFIMPTGHS